MTVTRLKLNVAEEMKGGVGNEAIVLANVDRLEDEYG